MTSSNVTIKHVRSESMFRRLHKPQLLFSGMLNWVNFLEKKEIKKCVREYKVRSGKRHHNAAFNRQDTRTIYPTLVRWCHTRRSATTIFSATQHCNIVATFFWMVTTLFHHCNAVLRQKSSMRIVLCKISIKRLRLISHIKRFAGVISLLLPISTQVRRLKQERMILIKISILVKSWWRVVD